MARILESLKVCNIFDPLKCLGSSTVLFLLLKSHGDHGHNGSVMEPIMIVVPKWMELRIPNQARIAQKLLSKMQQASGT